MYEVLVNTDPGAGDNYSHPVKPQFDNPITAVHHISDSCGDLKFETADGVIGAHPPS